MNIELPEGTHYSLASKNYERFFDDIQITNVIAFLKIKKDNELEYVGEIQLIDYNKETKFNRLIKRLEKAGMKKVKDLYYKEDAFDYKIEYDKETKRYEIIKISVG
jgi:hypothetical protein